ncbi:ABC-type nitrate/sulfonate/bicarbonate transport system substrate-binding protein [Bradyrhizobium sp. AZCC 2262]|uniref:ABC transporter substrate-binding protein n=1 Tax=Bradyrhizobium sp. AZCC 2262 TaxID=3117022 RepID=UPI002FEED8ED
MRSIAAVVGRRGLARAAGAVALAAVMALGAVPSPAQDITIGEGIALGWGQFFVADHDKTWEKHGLIPKVSTFASGRLVLDALVGGGVVIGTAAETPVVFATLNGLPVRIIATMNRHEPFDLVAIKDIKTNKDIKGRRIGYSQGTNAHLYLSKLLKQEGLSWSDITAVSLNPGDFVSSLAGGAIDGFIWTEPHLSQAVGQAPDKFHIIRAEGLYNTYSTVITLQSTIDSKPDLLVKALKALIEADDNIKRDPDAAATLTAERIKLDPAIAKAFWKRANFKFDLDKPALVSQLEEQARWAVDNKLVRPDAKIPDFNTVVVTSVLDKARRE